MMSSQMSGRYGWHPSCLSVQVNTLSYEENVAYRAFVQTHLSQVCC